MKMKFQRIHVEIRRNAWLREALYESSVRKLGWRFTARLPYRTAVNWPEPGPAKIRNFGRRFHVFSGLLYSELLVCYIQIIYIVLKFNFVWVSASVLDQSLVNNSCASSSKCWKNDEIFEFSWKIAAKSSGSGNLYWSSSPWRKFWEHFDWGDLLYEFPAETRLTVYRRLDIPNRGELASPWPREDSW